MPTKSKIRTKLFVNAEISTIIVVYARYVPTAEYSTNTLERYVVVKYP